MEIVNWFNLHKAKLSEVLKCDDPEIAICADDEIRIQAQIMRSALLFSYPLIPLCYSSIVQLYYSVCPIVNRLAEGGCHLIITTGGTGLGVSNNNDGVLDL